MFKLNFIALVKRIGFLALLTIIFGCKSVKLVDSYKNPENVIFTAYKVLLVGMTANEEQKIAFESKLKEEFDKRNIESMRSIDLFDVSFTASAKTDDELAAVERQLLDKDFDAIVFAKVLGSESKQSFRKNISNWSSNGTFREDYVQNQGIYTEANHDQFKVYNTETTIYCICEGKERSLVWRGSIDFMEPKNMDKTIDDYVKLLVDSMEEQDIIFRKE